MRLSWLDSFGILGGGGLTSLALLSAAASSVLGFAALRNGSKALVRGSIADSPELEQISRFEPGMLAFRGERLDVRAEAHWTLSELAPRAAYAGVQLRQAIAPGLAVWMDRRAFRKLLVGLLEQAIGEAPCGQVLLTAGSHGGRVQIAVSHDAPASTRQALETALRPAMEIAALNGGTVEVIVRAEDGATVVVRLPGVAGSSPASARSGTGTQAHSPILTPLRALQRTPEPTANP